MPPLNLVKDNLKRNVDYIGRDKPVGKALGDALDWIEQHEGDAELCTHLNADNLRLRTELAALRDQLLMIEVDVEAAMHKRITNMRNDIARILQRPGA
jgi:ribosomal protein L29